MFITATIKNIFPMETAGNVNRRNALVEYAEHDEQPKNLLVTFFNGKSELLETIPCGCTAEIKVVIKTIEAMGKFVTSVYGEEIKVVADKENPFDNELERDDYINAND